MWEALQSSLVTLLRHVRVADVIDVSLLALFIYGLITWLRQSTSRSAARRAVVILVLFAGLFVLVRYFDLYLMERLLQVMLVVLLLAAVILFQSDIKRMLDRVGSWSLRSPSAPTRSADVVDVMTETMAQLASEHVGALVAIRGREPWDALIQGGVPLDGEISKPLLLSLFDDKTPGHDGAVLVDGVRIRRFAAHLPLTENLPEASQFGGTRHAAARGLAERCDALVIIVSEERGTISVAQGDRLDVMESASDLRARLKTFWRPQEHDEARDHELRVRRVRRASLAFALAAALWLLFAYSPETVYRNLDVPIELRNLPDGWVVQDSIPGYARVTLTGSEQAFRMLDPEALTLSVDLSDPVRGDNVFTLSDDDLELPADVMLQSIHPGELSVQAVPVERVRVPVVVETSGVLADSLVLEGMAVRPDSVTLLVPQTADEPPPFVPTQALDLGRLPADGVVGIRLRVPAGTQLADRASPQVNVRVRTRPADAPVE